MKSNNINTKIKSVSLLAVIVGMELIATFTFANVIESATIKSFGGQVGLESAHVSTSVVNFSEGAPAPEISTVKLAPATPKVADFEEIKEPVKSSSIQDLAPAAPAEAEFEDHI